MSAGSVKTTPRLVEPRVGRGSNPAPMLSARPAPPIEGRWLVYQLPSWIHDDNVKACLSCQTKFTLWNRRHHCRACGGIYCSDCARESWLLPQFDVLTPERLCNSCMKTQSVIFELHAKLTTTINGLEAHNARYNRLLMCAQTLQVGAMFNVFLDGSMRPRKLALSDDLLMIALINTRTNRVTNAYEVLQISVSAGAHEDAKSSIGNSQLCFTMACHDQIFTLQALNLDLYQYWMDGIHLAQEMVMHKERVAEFDALIADTKEKLHAAIQSQINFAFPKVFPDAAESSSALTLISETEGENLQLALADSDSDDGESRKSNLKQDMSGGTNAMAVESAPPVAVKMGRSVPRPPGYLSPEGGGARSPLSLASPRSTSPPITSSSAQLATSPISPVSSVLSDGSDDPSPESSLGPMANGSARDTIDSEPQRATQDLEQSRVSMEQPPSTGPILIKQGRISPTANHESAPEHPTSAAAAAPLDPVIEKKKTEFISIHGSPASSLDEKRSIRHVGQPRSIDAKDIVSGIAATSLVSSNLSLTFDSLPSTPVEGEQSIHSEDANNTTIGLSPVDSTTQEGDQESSAPRQVSEVSSSAEASGSPSIQPSKISEQTTEAENLTTEVEKPATEAEHNETTPAHNEPDFPATSTSESVPNHIDDSITQDYTSDGATKPEETVESGSALPDASESDPASTDKHKTDSSSPSEEVPVV